MLRATRLLLASVWLSGCTAFYEPLAEDAGGPPAAPAPGLATVTVLIRRPELADPPPPEYPAMKDVAPEDLLQLRQSASDRALEDLSATGLFAGARYDTGEPAPGAVLVDVRLPRPDGYCGDLDVLLPALTLGLVPSTCKRERGLYLRAVGQSRPDFACRWPQTEMLGWLPALLTTSFGSWTREPNRDAYLAHLRSCIAAQPEAFE